MNLLNELRALIDALDSEGIEYALCGGLAMVVHAFPRSTVDIDLIVRRSDFDRIRAIAVDLGYTIDAGSKKLAEGRIDIHRLTRIDPETQIALPLDFMFVSEAIQTVWDSRVRLSWNFGQISTVSIDGLIELQRMRSNGQDRDDIVLLERLRNEG